MASIAGFRSALLLAFLLGSGSSLSAQITLNVGAGLGIVPSGSISRQTQIGVGVSAGAGINFNRYFATSLEFNSNSVDVNLAQNLGFDSVKLWSFTADPRIKFDITQGLQVYATGGYGLYMKQDPLNGTAHKGGINGGGGLGVRISESATLYFEMRFHRMFTTGRDTTYEPIIFGVRWH